MFVWKFDYLSGRRWTAKMLFNLKAQECHFNFQICARSRRRQRNWIVWCRHKLTAVKFVLKGHINSRSTSHWEHIKSQIMDNPNWNKDVSSFIHQNIFSFLLFREILLSITLFPSLVGFACITRKTLKNDRKFI